MRPVERIESMNNRAKRMSDESVTAATGKGWSEWFALLDEAKAVEMKHAGIVQVVHERHGAPGWWAQMVTVQYERERGLREVHQTARGYSVSVSKTMGASIEVAYAAWEDEEQRRRWLAEPIKVRKANANKSMRIEFGGVGSNLTVNFYAKGESKTQVTVQQTKLEGQAEVASSRAFWKSALAELAEGVASV